MEPVKRADPSRGSAKDAKKAKPRGARQQENSDATRAALVREAIRLFGKKGYATTSIDEIADAARVTKGAFYHHFDHKQAIFDAACEATCQRVAVAIFTAMANEDNAYDRAIAGLIAFFDAASEPGARRISFEDGPSVLGFRRWREIDQAHSAAHLPIVLDELMNEGIVERQPVAPLATTLLGAIKEAALAIADAKDATSVRDGLVAALIRILDGLAPPGRPRRARA